MAVALLAGLLAGAALTRGNGVETVASSPVTRGPVAGMVRGSGHVQHSEIVAVAASAEGRVTEVLVAPGHTVARGQVLARMDSAAPRAELLRAEADVVAAEVAQLEAEVGFIRLITGAADVAYPPPDGAQPPDGGTIAVAHAQVIRTGIEAAARRSAYRGARRRVRDCLVRSPVSGLVVWRGVARGETLQAGAALFRVAPTAAPLEVIVDLRPAAARDVRVGQTVDVAAAGSAGDQATGRVARMVPADVGAAGTPTIRVWVEFPRSGVRLPVGVPVDVAIGSGSPAPVLRVPAAALDFAPRGQRRTGRPASVWVVARDGGGLSERRVQVGASDGDHAEVLAADLREGDHVAIGFARTARP